MSLTTKVVVFGDDVSSSSGVEIVSDSVGNMVDGEEKTEFYPGDGQYLLVIVPDEYRLLSVAATDGDIVATGLVSREQVDRVLFAEKNVSESLSQNIAGSITPVFYGGAAVLTVEDGAVRASAAPVIADLSYNYAAYQYRLDIPSGLEIGDDDDYPIGVVAYVEAVEP